jgi:hypothetical protein
VDQSAHAYAHARTDDSLRRHATKLHAAPALLTGSCVRACRRLTA